MTKEIARQIENRGVSRTVQKKAISKVMKAGALGCKTMCKGRINGAEIALLKNIKKCLIFAYFKTTY